MRANEACRSSGVDSVVIVLVAELVVRVGDRERENTESGPLSASLSVLKSLPPLCLHFLSLFFPIPRSS